MAKPQLRAAKYRRISDDREGRELGVTRQDEDLDKLAAQRGYQVVADYCDNDRGASTRSRKKRPEYDRMLADARAGDFDVILAYTSARLTRRPLEHEAQIGLAEQHGIRYDFVRSPSFDLGTASGRQIARTLAAQDAAESEIISERVQRAREDQARHGRFGGGNKRRFGFEPDGITVREGEAVEIRMAADQVLLGVSLRAVAKDLNTRGVVMGSGKPWEARRVRDTLLLPRIAGLVVHRGEVLENVVAPWAPIIPRGQWEALCSMLRDTSRRSYFGGNQAKYLGANIYRCGHPDHEPDERPPMITSWVTSKGMRLYRCRDSPGHLARAAVPIDELVQDVVTARLARKDAAALLAARPNVDTAKLDRDAGQLRAQIAEAGDLWEDGILSRADVTSRVRRLRAKLDVIEARQAASAERDPLAGIAGNPDAVAIWRAFPLDRKRGVLDRVATVTIHKGRRGRSADGSYLDPSTIDITTKRRPT